MPPKPKPKPAIAVPSAAELTVDLKSLQNVTDILAGVKQLRQYYQLERDKVHKFWEITQKEVENNKNELLNLDEEMEEMENKHQVEIKVYKQKVRHLLYEHRLQVQDIRAQCDRDITQAMEEHQQRMARLAEEKAKLYTGMHRDVVDHEESITAQRKTHLNMLTSIKHGNYRDRLDEMEQRYKNRLVALREELDLRRRAEVHEIEERKNEHINQLIRLHQSKFAEMKNYYNHITGNNLDLIRSLKEEIANMKKNDEHNENLMYDIEKENQHLSEPLEKARRDVAELQLQLHSYEKDKVSLAHTRSRLRAVDADYRQLLEDHNALQKRYQEVHDDREMLKSRFEGALTEAVDSTQESNLALQQRLTELQAATEEKDIQLASILRAVNLEPAAQDAITRGLEEALDGKNRAIKDLHYELKKIEKNHRDIVTEYERRCIAAGIPVLDLELIV